MNFIPDIQEKRTKEQHSCGHEQSKGGVMLRSQPSPILRLAFAWFHPNRAQREPDLEVISLEPCIICVRRQPNRAQHRAEEHTYKNRVLSCRYFPSLVFIYQLNDTPMTRSRPAPNNFDLASLFPCDESTSLAIVFESALLRFVQFIVVQPSSRFTLPCLQCSFSKFVMRALWLFLYYNHKQI